MKLKSKIPNLKTVIVLTIAICIVAGLLIFKKSPTSETKNYQTIVYTRNVLGQQATAGAEGSDPVVSDTFADETKIASKVNLLVSGGQVRLFSCTDNGQACSADASCCSTICGTDADNDGYFSQALGHTGTCQAASKPYTDCDDTTGTKWQTLTCYRDADADTYTLAGAALCTGSSCSSPDATYKSSASSPLDCYDANANAKPGQTTYYTTNRGDGSFDYNCDGQETLNDCISSCPGTGCFAGCRICGGGWLSTTVCGTPGTKITSCRSYSGAGCTGSYYGTITTSCTGTQCLPAGDPCTFASQWFGGTSAAAACR